MTAPVDISLLTQSACAFCEHAKDVLRRVGQDHQLRITEIDLGSEEGQRLARQGGVMFAPGVFIDGEPFSYGRLSERKFRRTLSKRAAPDMHPGTGGAT